MPRAKIPYDALEEQLDALFPPPAFRRAEILRPTRARTGRKKIRAPTTIYDRSSGNYAVIGYMTMVRYQELTDVDYDEYNGLYTRYTTREHLVPIMLDPNYQVGM